MIGRMFALAAGLCLIGQASMIGSAEAEPRLALVIGNSHYGKEIGELPNPVNDAGLIASALQQTGFTVIKVTDADQKKMKRAIADFGDKLAAAGPTATGLFFYAGHGVQVNGTNYLVPIGADISKEADVDIESVAADKVMDQMAFAGSRVNIVVLDACRNNPLQRSFRLASRGLAPMEAARGSFVAYSTAPGSVAADGSGQNSPYTAALAKTIVKPGVGIEEAFRDVRAAVMAATEEKQIPWDSSSLTAPFFFKSGSAAQFTTATQSAAAPSAASLDSEKRLWDGIKDSKQASDYQAYLSQYPNGIFAGVAQNRLAAMGQGVPREQPTVPEVQQPVSAPIQPKETSEPPPAPIEDASVSEEKAAEAKALADKCKYRDDTMSDSDLCRRQRKNGGYGGGGSRSTGSNKWK